MNLPQSDPAGTSVSAENRKVFESAASTCAWVMKYGLVMSPRVPSHQRSVVMGVYEASSVEVHNTPSALIGYQAPSTATYMLTLISAPVVPKASFAASAELRVVVPSASLAASEPSFFEVDEDDEVLDAVVAVPVLVAADVPAPPSPTDTWESAESSLWTVPATIVVWTTCDS